VPQIQQILLLLYTIFHGSRSWTSPNLSWDSWICGWLAPGIRKHQPCTCRASLEVCGNSFETTFPTLRTGVSHGSYCKSKLVLLRIFNFSAMMATKDSDDQRNKPGGTRKKKASIFGGR
jgi:hypothetical protein